MGRGRREGRAGRAGRGVTRREKGNGRDEDALLFVSEGGRVLPFSVDPQLVAIDTAGRELPQSLVERKRSKRDRAFSRR
jgi:hypothetical protein